MVDANYVNLRRVEAGDVRFFSRWWRDADLIALTSGNRQRLSERDVERYFESMLKSTADANFMTDIGGRTAGHVALMAPYGGWRETTIVIGDKAYTGMGIGTAALQSLLKLAKKQGVLRIRLEVRPDNARAIRSYSKCGFALGRLKRYPRNKNLPVVRLMSIVL